MTLSIWSFINRCKAATCFCTSKRQYANEKINAHSYNHLKYVLLDCGARGSVFVYMIISLNGTIGTRVMRPPTLYLFLNETTLKTRPCVLSKIVANSSFIFQQRDYGDIFLDNIFRIFNYSRMRSEMIRTANFTNDTREQIDVISYCVEIGRKSRLLSFML